MKSFISEENKYTDNNNSPALYYVGPPQNANEQRNLPSLRINEQNRIETGMGPMTDKLINELIDGFAIDNYQDKINDKFVDPITKIINQRIQPYIYASGILYIVIIMLLLIIIYMLNKKRK